MESKENYIVHVYAPLRSLRHDKHLPAMYVDVTVCRVTFIYFNTR